MNEKSSKESRKQEADKRTDRLWKPWIFLVFAGILVLGGAVLVFGYRRHRSQGTVIVPQRETPVLETVFYRQKDERWAEDVLGESRYRMRGSGCLVCCIAASLTMQGREETDPGMMNRLLSQNGGYDEEGNLQWDALSALDSRISAERCQTVDEEAVMENLEAGRFPIVRVRLNGTGSVHYVLITGARDGEYWCMDPLAETEEETALSAFAGRVYAVRYVDWKPSGGCAN